MYFLQKASPFKGNFLEITSSTSKTDMICEEAKNNLQKLLTKINPVESFLEKKKSSNFSIKLWDTSTTVVKSRIFFFNLTQKAKYILRENCVPLFWKFNYNNLIDGNEMGKEHNFTYLTFTFYIKDNTHRYKHSVKKETLIK